MRTKSKESSLNQGLREVEGSPVIVDKDSDQLDEILKRVKVTHTSYVVMSGFIKRDKRKGSSGD